MNAHLALTLAEIYDLEKPRLPTVDYLVGNGIDVGAVVGFVGSPTVLPISLLPNRRFDLPDHGADAVDGVIIEARSEDGDSVIDLVAWPIANPTDVHTLCGAAPMLGLWQAFNAATYVFDCPLIVHRTPLDWLKADCNGAAIVIPKLAVRTFLEISDIGGRIGAEDFNHAHELRRHLDAMTKHVEIVAPKPNRIAA